MKKVLKTFRTATRRFNPGDLIAEADIQDHALQMEQLVKSGFVEGRAQVKRGKATKET